jgi:hypothetical protein
LFRDFRDGQVKLSHDELFGLATNLVNVDTGSRWFRDVLAANSRFYGDKLGKWVHDLDYMKQLGYRPRSCDGFCPRCNTCDHGANILSAASLRRGTMEMVPGYEETFSSVVEVEQDVRRAIEEAYHAKGTGWYIVKAMTAIGKSSAFLGIMSDNPQDRFLIAVPTNILKTEIYEKAVRLGIEVMMTPSLEEIKGKIERD